MLSAMNILAIDTSSSACSLALSIDNELNVFHEPAPMQQAQIILSQINTLLDASKIKRNQLDAIAFGCGPGSFTGIRIATSVAQGLGFGLGIPLFPISSLAALAQATYNELKWTKLFVAIDAHVQEVYCAQYEEKGHGLVELIGKEQICSPSQIPVPNEDEWAGVGNGWEIYKDKLPFQPIKIDSTRLPMASALIQLATPLIQENKGLAPEQATPIYLRDEVATKEKRR